MKNKIAILFIYIGFLKTIKLANKSII